MSFARRENEGRSVCAARRRRENCRQPPRIPAISQREGSLSRLPFRSGTYPDVCAVSVYLRPSLSSSNSYTHALPVCELTSISYSSS